jgi:manganese/iron transport system ATP-binding protein
MAQGMAQGIAQGRLSDLSVEAVSVVYPNGHSALRDASFRLEAGTICALVGVNGAGKSTLFKAIMGLVRPGAGRVLIGGEPVEAALRRNRVAYVPQSEEVDWSFPVRVRDVVMMGRYGHMGILRLSRAADREAVATALGRVGLSDLADRQIGELSGGQRKRVFLARAMAQGAEILLLDEPFTGVDATTEQTIIGLLRVFREEGRIVLVSTHDLGSIPQFCDQVVLVNRTVLAAGPTEKVFTEGNLRLAFGDALRTPERFERREPVEQPA